MFFSFSSDDGSSCFNLFSSSLDEIFSATQQKTSLKKWSDSCVRACLLVGLSVFCLFVCTCVFSDSYVFVCVYWSFWCLPVHLFITAFLLVFRQRNLHYSQRENFLFAELVFEFWSLPCWSCVSSWYSLAWRGGTEPRGGCHQIPQRAGSLAFLSRKCMKIIFPPVVFATKSPIRVISPF